jgi:hypothetical protein
MRTLRSPLFNFSPFSLSISKFPIPSLLCHCSLGYDTTLNSLIFLFLFLSSSLHLFSLPPLSFFLLPPLTPLTPLTPSYLITSSFSLITLMLNFYPIKYQMEDKGSIQRASNTFSDDIYIRIFSFIAYPIKYS